MEYFCFVLKSGVSIDLMWEALLASRCHLLYANEEFEGEKQIYGFLPEGLSPSEFLKKYDAIESLYPVTFDQINWHDQWGTSNENPSIYIDLKKYDTQNAAIPARKNKPAEIIAQNGFFMKPGPGFGDLSHPTTQLALEMMAPIVQGKFVIDLGCGSGVLSFAAAQLGAGNICGIDIDSDALSHANTNLELNGHLHDKIHFQLPTEKINIPSGMKIVLVMNMISQEQEMAWQSLPQLHALPMICVTTGILKGKKQEKAYIEVCKKRGWIPQKCLYKDKWCGFVMGTANFFSAIPTGKTKLHT